MKVEHGKNALFGLIYKLLKLQLKNFFEYKDEKSY